MKSEKNAGRTGIRVPSMARTLIASNALSSADRLLIVAVLAEASGFIGAEDLPKPTKNIPAFLCDTIKREVDAMQDAAEEKKARRKTRAETSTDKDGMSEDKAEMSTECPRNVRGQKVLNLNHTLTIPPNGVVGECDGHVRECPDNDAPSPSEVVAAFREFYEAYPRQGNRPGALDEWKKAAERGELPPPAVVMAALARWKASERWREGTRYVPYASNWIRGRQWNDPPDGVSEKNAAPPAPEDPALPCPPSPEDLEDPERRLLFLRSPAWRKRVEAWCRLNAREEWLAEALAAEDQTAGAPPRTPEAAHG